MIASVAFVGLVAACPIYRLGQPFFAAISRPNGVAGAGRAFVLVPVQEASRTRSFSLNVGATMGPRVEVKMSRPAWMSRSSPGPTQVGLSNSQLFMTTRRA